MNTKFTIHIWRLNMNLDRIRILSEYYYLFSILMLSITIENIAFNVLYWIDFILLYYHIAHSLCSGLWLGVFLFSGLKAPQTSKGTPKRECRVTGWVCLWYLERAFRLFLQEMLPPSIKSGQSPIRFFFISDRKWGSSPALAFSSNRPKPKQIWPRRN